MTMSMTAVGPADNGGWMGFGILGWIVTGDP